MKNFRYILFSCLLLTALYGCTKKQTEFKEFFNGHEIVYTGAVGNTVVQPGNLEIGLKWAASTDPSITRYVIYYNNKADSQVVKITAKTDTIRTIIKGLAEYTYSFTIYSYDSKGNRSIPVDINNAKVYGPVYNSKLLNRGYNAANPYKNNANGSVTLNFITPDTINTKTVVRYTDKSSATVEKILSPDSSSITLPNYKQGTKIQYQSYYIPQRNAIDTFAVSRFDDFPDIILQYVQCDKSLFKSMSLPNDVHADFGTSFEKLWDGSVGPQSYPNIFHSNESPLPHHFTFDLGTIYYNLARIEETGRDQSHNPLDFEVWGIADVTNAATTLPGTDAGWAAEMKAKGWTLLKECVRTDDGKQAMKFDFIGNPPPVRYIRIRVKTNATGESYSNISEFTLWNLQ